MTSFAHYRVGNEHMHPVMVNTVEDEPGSFIESLQKRLKIRIISMDDNDVEFDLIGVDASIANALRRIMLAEVKYHSTNHFPTSNSLLYFVRPFNLYFLTMCSHKGTNHCH